MFRDFPHGRGNIFAENCEKGYHLTCRANVSKGLIHHPTITISIQHETKPSALGIGYLMRKRHAAALLHKQASRQDKI